VLTPAPPSVKEKRAETQAGGAVQDSSPTPQATETGDQGRRRPLAQLQAAAAPLLEQMADTLADVPDRELFRSVEVRLRDLGQPFAAAAWLILPPRFAAADCGGSLSK
jgi:hypothetical protein